MRAHRRPTTAVVAAASSVIATLAIGLGLITPMVVASADADVPVADLTELPTATPTATPTVAGQRKITSKTRQQTFNQYLLYGTVQDLPDGTAMLQKKTCVACKWDVVRKVSTNEKGWYKVKIFAPKTGQKNKKNLWRIMVPTSEGYSKSYSRVWAIVLR